MRGLPLRYADYAGFGIWATELPDEADPFTRDDLLDHHAIVSRIHERADACLPARFPTWFSAQAVAEGAAGLREALERVRGRTEIAVTAVWTRPDEAPPPSAPRPGTDYLLRRKRAIAGSEARHRRATELADELERRVADGVIEARRTICPSERVALSLALLVPRSAASELLSQVECSGQDVRILVNGPWPPYTFAVVG